MVESSAAAWFGALGFEVTSTEEEVVRVQTPDVQVVLYGLCGHRTLSKDRRAVVLCDV